MKRFLGSFCLVILVFGIITACVNPNKPTPSSPTLPKSTATILCGGLKDLCNITVADSVIISWSSTDAASCYVTGTSWTGTSGSQNSGALLASQDYEVRCTGSGGDVSNSVVKVVVDPLPGGPGTLSFNFTSVPPMGSSNNLKGNLLHVLPSDYKVFCWINVNGFWWPKPTFAEPLTKITANGSWECDITTGGGDTTATEIRAYLVTSSYVWTSGVIPSVNGRDVVAMIVAKR